MNLRNNYYILRHAISIANEQNMICSDPSRALDGCGLSDRGREQAYTMLLHPDLDVSLVIYSSDFLRSIETASIIRERLNAAEVKYTPLLRERFFGKYEGGTSDSYEKVWEKDSGNPDNIWGGVESPRSVQKRMIGHLRYCEKQHNGETILFVSHGDPIQILLVSMAGLPSDRHREIEPVGNCDLRKIVMSDNCETGLIR